MKVATVLTQRKAIEIGGGNYTTGNCKFKCPNCEEIYDINYTQDRNICPLCGSEEVFCKKEGKQCRKWCEEE